MRYPYQTADPTLYGLLKEYAAKHRAYPTDAESMLWNHLRANQLGYRYRPQHIIGPFIADFASLTLKLIIEIDGGYHSLPEQMISDDVRTEWLARWGFKVIRFTNEQIFNNIEEVIDKIKSEQDARYK